jgi:hypothetical protein
MNYHGDICMCGSMQNESLVEYVVRFTHGAVEWIWPYDALPDVQKTWFCAKD